jgi:hypothetical protein
MKRTVAAFILMSALLFSTLSGVCFVSLVVANPYTGPPLNDTPDKNSPSITINNLENSTWNNKIVSFSLAVEKPSSWFEESSLEDRPPQGKLVSVDCIIDGSQKVNLANSGDLVDEYRRPEPLRLNGNLPEMPDGKHTVRFSVDFVSYYLSPDRDTSYFGFWKAPDFPDKYNQTTYSNEVSFIIGTTRPEPEKEPFPTTLAMSASGAVAVIAACGWLLFKKRKS